MNRRLIRRGDERGAIAVITAILSLVLFGVAAFVTDLGMAYANQRNLQNGADAAALAAGRYVALNAARSGTDCAGVAAAYNSDATTTSRATTYFKSNVPGANGASPSATLSTFEVKCEAVAGQANKSLVVVHATGSQTSPGFFGRLFGRPSISISKEARAIVAPASPYGLRPFAVCAADANAMVTAAAAGGTTPKTIVFPPTSNHASNNGCGSAVGNTGLLDLDGGGGGRGAGPSGCSGVTGWIICGFNGTLPDPSNINAQTGAFGSSLDSAMSTLSGKDIALPVYSTVNGNGNNAIYSVTGFIVVNVCGWSFQEKPSDVVPFPSAQQFSCYNGPELITAAATASTTFGNQKMDFLQVRYIKTVTYGEIDQNCAIGNAGCDNGNRVAVLAD